MRRDDDVVLEPLAKDETVVHHRCQEHPRRRSAEGERDDVDGTLSGVQRVEALGEGEAEQERKEDLHTSLGHPHLLEKLDVVPVDLLSHGLAPDPLVPLLLRRLGTTVWSTDGAVLLLNLSTFRHDPGTHT